MQAVKEVIEQLGGYSYVAYRCTKAGQPVTPQAVVGWVVSGNVPSKHVHTLLEIADEKNLTVDVDVINRDQLSKLMERKNNANTDQAAV